jgi:glutamine synthetase type III
MPRENLRFLFFCAALLRAVEASPANVSLNDDLEAVLAAIARGDDSRALSVRGKGFEVRGALGESALEEAIDDLTLDIEAWTAAGDDLRCAVREVIADSYRRHCALVLS